MVGRDGVPFGRAGWLVVVVIVVLLVVPVVWWGGALKERWVVGGGVSGVWSHGWRVRRVL